MRGAAADRVDVDIDHLFRSAAAGAAIDCASKARVLCENEQNSNDLRMTVGSYPLAQADLACEAEFGKQPFGSGPVFSSATTQTTYTTPGSGTSNPESACNRHGAGFQFHCVQGAETPLVHR